MTGAGGQMFLSIARVTHPWVSGEYTEHNNRIYAGTGAIELGYYKGEPGKPFRQLIRRRIP
jgi:hypothetical protein